MLLQYYTDLRYVIGEVLEFLLVFECGFRVIFIRSEGLIGQLQRRWTAILDSRTIILLRSGFSVISTEFRILEKEKEGIWSRFLWLVKVCSDFLAPVVRSQQLSDLSPVDVFGYG